MPPNKVELVLAIREEGSGTLQEVEAKFATSMANLQRSSSTAMDDIASKFTHLLGPAAIAGFTVAASKMGIEWERTIFQMRQTFQSASDAMIAKASEMSVKMGHYFSQQEISYAFVKTADSMKRYGVDGQNYLNLVARASDVAAAKGLTVKESIDRIESAIRGEAEASEYLGLTLNDTYMKNMAFGGSLRDTWEALNDNQKAMYRFNELMEQSSKYQGAAAEAAKTFGGELQGWWNWFKDDFSRGMANANKALGDFIAKMKESKGLQGAGTSGAQALGAVHGDTGDDPWGIRALVDQQNKMGQAVDSTFKVAQAWKEVIKAAEEYEALKSKKNSGNQYYDFYMSSVEKITAALPKTLSEELRINNALQNRKTLIQQIESLRQEMDSAESDAAYNLADTAYQAKLSQLKLAENEANAAQESRIARIRAELENMLKDPNGGFDNPNAQKKIADMLKERSSIEQDINSRLERRAELERQMNATDDQEEMLAIRDAIYEIDSGLVPLRYQLGMLDDMFGSLEKLRITTIDAQTESAEQKIKSLMEKINDFERQAAEKVSIQLDTSEAESAIQGLIDKVKELHEFMKRDLFSEAVTFDIDAGIYASPRHSFSDGIDYMTDKLSRLPKSANFDMFSGGWDGLSMSTDWVRNSAEAKMMVTQQYDIGSLPSGLQGEASQLARLLNQAIEAMQANYSGPSPAGIAQPSSYWMGEEYFNNVVPRLQAKLDSLFAASSKLAPQTGKADVKFGDVKVDISDIRTMAAQIEKQIMERLNANRSSLIVQM